MKKKILGLCLMAISGAAFAQDDTQKSQTTMMTSTGNYSALTVTPPSNLNVYIQRDYPAVTNVVWYQPAVVWDATDNNAWYHAYYVQNGQPMHTYYNFAGKNFNVALPVRQTLVPEEVAAKALEMYGPTLYDITAMKGVEGAEIYTVRTLENGQVVSHRINADGTAAAEINWSNSTEDANSGMSTNSSMNNNMNTNGTTTITTGTDADTKIKIKTENADGTKTKTKIKDGKVKKDG